ncbi:MAG: hydrogenase maturation nickel metallochaperone HypA [Bdellovibrionia bacterium]
MHELGITQEIVEILSLRANELQPNARIKRVVLEIGKLSAVLPDAIRFCFDLCTEGTPVEGASLQILEPQGQARCRLCKSEMLFEQPFGECVCGGIDLEWLSGGELRIKEMELE